MCTFQFQSMDFQQKCRVLLKGKGLSQQLQQKNRKECFQVKEEGLRMSCIHQYLIR